MSDKAAEPAGPANYSRVVLREDETDGGFLVGTLGLEVARGIGEPYPSESLSVGEALLWARSVADIVVICAGGQRYSAGWVPEPDIATWTDGTELRVRRSYEVPGPQVEHYWVRVSGDAGELPSGLIDGLGRLPRVRDVRMLSPDVVALSVSQSSEDVLDYVSDAVSKIRSSLLTIGELMPANVPRGITTSVSGPDLKSGADEGVIPGPLEPPA